MQAREERIEELKTKLQAINEELATKDKEITLQDEKIQEYDETIKRLEMQSDLHLDPSLKVKMKQLRVEISLPDG